MGVDDCIYEVYGKHETRTEGEVHLEGSNASAEEADEGTDSCSTSGIDVVLNHRLTETGFGSKKDYLVYLKDYMKKVVKYLEDNNRAGEVNAFKKNINNYMKDLLAKFKDLQFFVGESMDNDAMIVIVLQGLSRRGETGLIGLQARTRGREGLRLVDLLF